MDGERFDELIKRLTVARLTRLEALRGLAGAAVVAGTGAAIVSDEAEAKGKKRGKRRNGNDRNKGKGRKAQAQQNTDKVTICHCPPGNPDNCHTISVGSKAAAAHLRNHPDDTEGECEEATTTTTGEVTTTSLEVTTTTGEVTTTTGEVTTTTGTVGTTSANSKRKRRRNRK